MRSLILIPRQWRALLALTLLMGCLPVVLGNDYLLLLFNVLAINALVVLGLNLLIGSTGQVSLGHAAFYGMGAYVSAIAGVSWQWPLPWALLLALLIVAVTSFLLALPTLRLEGHYLVMATLGFNIIVNILLVQMEDLTGGPSGFPGIARLHLGSIPLKTDLSFYCFIWTLFLLVFALTLNLTDSRIGRALQAIHENDLTAQALGIPSYRFKVITFVLSALYAALAGFCYAHYVTFISPKTFDIFYSVQVVTMVVIGGMGSLWGGLAGAAILTFLPEWLHSFEDLHVLLYGLILMGVLVFCPQGVTPAILSLPFFKKFKRTESEGAAATKAPDESRPPRPKEDAPARRDHRPDQPSASTAFTKSATSASSADSKCSRSAAAAAHSSTAKFLAGSHTSTTPSQSAASAPVAASAPSRARSSVPGVSAASSVSPNGDPSADSSVQALTGESASSNDCFTSGASADSKVAAPEACALSIRNVSVSFGGIQALHQIHMDVPPGAIVALIGPNGAGKTTLLNVASGLIRPREGSIQLCGRNIVGLAPYRIAAAGVGRTFQAVQVNHKFNVIENILLGYHHLGRAGFLSAFLHSPRERREERELTEKAYTLLEEFEMEDKACWPIQRLSLFDQKLLETARALALSPAVLLMDEPAGGLNPRESELLVERISALRGRGMGIVLVEHDMNVVMRLADSVTVLQHGCLLASGAPKEIQQNPEVIAAYLGVKKPGSGGPRRC